MISLLARGALICDHGFPENRQFDFNDVLSLAKLVDQMSAQHCKVIRDQCYFLFILSSK